LDVTVAATAHARSIPNNDKRLEIERAAGALLEAGCVKTADPAWPRAMWGIGVGKHPARSDGTPQ